MGRNHLRLASTLPGMRLVGIYDQNIEAAQQLATQIGTTAFASPEQLLEAVSAVIIATPTTTHYDLAKLAMNAGKHIFIEKPFSGDPVKAAELALSAKEKGLLLFVGMIESFNPAFQKLQRLLKGTKLHGIDIKRFSPFPERITDTDVIFDMMIHDLHLLLLLTSEPIESIKAVAKKIKSPFYDHVITTIHHNNGLISRVEGNRVFGSKVRNITVTAEKEVFDCDLLNKRIYVRDFLTPSPSALAIKPFDQISAELNYFVESIKDKALENSNTNSVIAALKLAQEVLAAC
ncbi:hypothetical protein A2311_06855 [candidate division WOR-1 bacterium RIFOXYB2_FULL_48_7]|uniref:Uncharacterized protein n=1 Tax=candidate division WOR-1 bacterium RIFOXYB2_FULL_48_7 TaxID=1802583 RepID=A0A1F4TVT3_UNCSA|nr:MAG: hypothetical protein A2311_06855 [candidate division WOR-1 bacterium RIFOXYB2_FULL_48_7]